MNKTTTLVIGVASALAVGFLFGYFFRPAPVDESEPVQTTAISIDRAHDYSKNFRYFMGYCDLPDINTPNFCVMNYQLAKEIVAGMDSINNLRTIAGEELPIAYRLYTGLEVQDAQSAQFVMVGIVSNAEGIEEELITSSNGDAAIMLLNQPLPCPTMCEFDYNLPNVLYGNRQGQCN